MIQAKTAIFTAAMLAMTMPLIVRAADSKDDVQSGKRAVPVVVELFTSEGCSSCPPADAVLARLATNQTIAGTQIIVLGEHVDYWNRLGWRDPFSSAAFSERQSVYASAFHSDQVYTPQMVVDGTREFVGSDESAALSAIAASSRRPKTEVTLSAPALLGGNVTFRLTAAGLDSGRGESDVVVAITEDGLSSQVKRGENAGHHLTHIAVVRSLTVLGTLRGHETFEKSVTLPLGPDWTRHSLHVVAFVQEQATRRIVGASEASL